MIWSSNRHIQVEEAILEDQRGGNGSQRGCGGRNFRKESVTVEMTSST